MDLSRYAAVKWCAYCGCASDADSVALACERGVAVCEIVERGIEI